MDERIERFVVLDESGCWFWIGACIECESIRANLKFHRLNPTARRYRPYQIERRMVHAG